MSVALHEDVAPHRPPHRWSRRIARIGIVGFGDVVRNRFCPALQSLPASIADIMVCSVEPSAPGFGLPHRYRQVGSHNRLPLQTLAEEGFLSENTLWIIATPSDAHVPYVLPLADYCRVAVEKPIAATNQEARLLEPLCRSGYEVYPIDHKIFNRGVLAFIEQVRAHPDILARVARIEGTFYEQDGICNGRRQEDGVADVQWHLAIVTRALFRAARIPIRMYPDEVLVARYGSDPVGGAQTPTVWTASRICGRLWGGRRAIPYDFRQAKAAPTSEKRIRLFDAAGALVAAIDLNESGWQAHARVLAALMQPVVEMHHTLADALDVMEFVENARSRAHEGPAHAFGELPDFCE